MPRPLCIAAIRMDANPSNVESRLRRARCLISQAVSQGAKLVVLPELFNTGYQYSSQNYQLAESPAGNTVSWMKRITREYGIHLAGSLLLREADGIYNAMLLIDPDGRLWRYDKSYPWAWERAYFRPRKLPVQAAETSLGKIGMLICWDVAHAALWAKYAGRIDLLVSSSCPPLAHRLDIQLPDGRTVNCRELGRLLQYVYRGADGVFGKHFLIQTRWLGVSSVNTTGAGIFRSHLPSPKFSATFFFAARPDLWKYIPQAEKITISAGYFDDTFIADRNGNVLAKTKINGDDLVIATVQPADRISPPKSPQPKPGPVKLAYLLDFCINSALKTYYNQHWQIKD